MEPWSVSEAKYEDFKLAFEWLFYEVYESIPYKKYNKNKEQDYLDNIKEAFSFSNLSDFLYFWIKSDYSKLTPLFTDPFSGLIKKIKGNKDNVQKIGSLALFKSGIKPMWEDKANKNGGEYSFKFNGTDPAIIVKIWETLVFSIIGHTMDEVDQVTGVRIVDKTNVNKGEYNFKIEIWVYHGMDSATNERWQNKIKQLLSVDDVCFVSHANS